MRAKLVAVLLFAAATQSVAQSQPQGSDAQNNTPTPDLSVETSAPKPTVPDQADPPKPTRPSINWLSRSQEDWSVLADPELRTDPFDSIKYIPLGSDPKRYLSLGLTVRERFESVSTRLTPLQPDDYLLDRMQFHADLHLGRHVQIFTQLIDARAPGKDFRAPVDQDRVDLEQAFIAVTARTGPGDVNFSIGRQEPDFDLQRFAAVQEGPNVRQPFNSVQLGYVLGDWRLVAFYSQPVLTLDRELFDDTSTRRFTLNGARLERQNFGHGKLSIFVAQLRNDNAFYLAASGHERRNIIDLHHAGRKSGWDWDLEGMAQWGYVGAKDIRAWSIGDWIGYTWAKTRWSPRLGFQVDAASGNRDPNGHTLGTFNPLFPNGFYEVLAGYPGYANFIHLRPSVRLQPAKKLSAVLDVASLFRQSTADAVYLLPAIPVPNTAGRGGAYSGTYGQVRLDWNISSHLTAALDTEYFAHSRSLQQAGARSGHFIGLELRFGI